MSSLSRIVERHAQFQPDRVALRFEGEDISYRRFWQRIEAASAGLAHRLGVVRGDHVAYLGYNHPEMLVLFLALARLGAVFVPLNFRLAVPELRAILAHSAASRLVAGFGFSDTARALVPVGGERALIVMDGDASSAQADASTLAGVGLAAPDSVSFVVGAATWSVVSAPGAEPVASSGQGSDPVMIVYTSGTTGLPKGAVHTHEAVIWNAINAIDYQGLVRDDHVLSALPMFHVGGLCIQTMPALHAGATVTIHARFDPGAWLREVAQSRPTVSLLVPATLKAVIEHPDWPGTDIGSLRMLNTGSSTVPEPLMRAFIDRGVVVTQVYGSTETGPVSIYLKPEDALRKLGSTGKVGLHVEVRLVDPQGRDVAHGEVGEILVRSPALMQGYWADPDNPSFRDGWFYSGDLARIDEEGFYHVAGRSKDMIISGGENIYPAELENILAGCPAIAEATVVGMPDARWGEVAVAVIVPAASAAPGVAAQGLIDREVPLDEAAVLALFRDRIARYKHPRRVVFVDRLPKSAIGKVQKGEVQRLLAGSDHQTGKGSS
jgi:fatty-acyl-CoA synthase